jgi:hypothetical protein
MIKKFATITAITLALFTSSVFADSKLVEIDGTVYEIPVSADIAVDDFIIKVSGSNVTRTVTADTAAELFLASKTLARVQSANYTTQISALLTNKSLASDALVSRVDSEKTKTKIEVVSSTMTTLVANKCWKGCSIALLDQLVAAKIDYDFRDLNSTETVYAGAMGAVDANIKWLETLDSVADTQQMTIENIREVRHLDREISRSVSAVNSQLIELTGIKGSDTGVAIAKGVSTSALAAMSLPGSQSILALITNLGMAYGVVFRDQVDFDSLNFWVGDALLAHQTNLFTQQFMIKNVASELKNALQLAEQAQAAIEIAESDIVEAKSLEQERTQSASELVAQIKLKKDDHEEFRQTLDEARDDLASATKLYEEKKSEVDAIADELEDLQGDIILYERAISNCDRGVTKCTSALRQSYVQTVNDLVQAEDELQESLRGIDGPLFEEKSAKEVYAQLTAQAEVDLNNSQQTLDGLGDQQSDIASEIAFLQSQQDSLQQEIKSQLAAVSDAEGLEQALFNEADDLQSELDQMPPPPVDSENNIPTVTLEIPDFDPLAELVTSSPVSISQAVDVPVDPFNFSFDYAFITGTGELDVYLGDTLLANLFGNSTPSSSLLNFSTLLDDDYLGALGLDLQFIFNDATGSKLWLDNIMFPGLVNGDFGEGDWTWGMDGSMTIVSNDFGDPTSGSTYIEDYDNSMRFIGADPGDPVVENGGGNSTVVDVPEPGSLALLILGLAGLGFTRRKQCKA